MYSKTYFHFSFVLMKINHSLSFQIWKNEIFFHVCSTNGKQSSSYLQRTTLRKIKAEIAVKENFFQTWNSWNISNSVTSNLIFRRRVIMRTKSLIFFDTIWYQICIIEINIIESNVHSKAFSSNILDTFKGICRYLI